MHQKKSSHTIQLKSKMCLLLGERDNHFEKRPLQCDPAIWELKCKYFAADFFPPLHGIVATHAFSKSTVWEKGVVSFYIMLRQ